MRRLDLRRHAPVIVIVLLVVGAARDLGGDVRWERGRREAGADRRARGVGHRGAGAGPVDRRRRAGDERGVQRHDRMRGQGRQGADQGHPALAVHRGAGLSVRARASGRLAGEGRGSAPVPRAGHRHQARGERCNETRAGGARHRAGAAGHSRARTRRGEAEAGPGRRRGQADLRGAQRAPRRDDDQDCDPAAGGRPSRDHAPFRGLARAGVGAPRDPRRDGRPRAARRRARPVPARASVAASTADIPHVQGPPDLRRRRDRALDRPARHE